METSCHIPETSPRPGHQPFASSAQGQYRDRFARLLLHTTPVSCWTSDGEDRLEDRTGTPDDSPPQISLEALEEGYVLQ